MKALMMIKKEVDVKYLRMTVPVRYGEEDIPNDFPLRQGDEWQALIGIDAAKILTWPEGQEGHLHMKVCDEGVYELLDAEMQTISKIDQNYVPNKIVPGSCGDYVDLKIDTQGIITNWHKQPSLEDFEEFSWED